MRLVHIFHLHNLEHYAYLHLAERHMSCYHKCTLATNRSSAVDNAMLACVCERIRAGLGRTVRGGEGGRGGEGNSAAWGCGIT